MNVISLLGPPGSGKTTLAKIIAKQTGYVWVSFGHIFRNLPDHSSYASKVQPYVDSGTSVPPEIAFQVFVDWYSAQDAHQGIIFDSQPRNMSDVPMFEQFLTTYHLHLARIFVLDLSEAEVKKRIRQRALYEHRGDEDPLVVQKRIGVFANDTSEVIKYYQEHGLVTILDATQEPARLAEKIIATFDTYD